MTAKKPKLVRSVGADALMDVAYLLGPYKVIRGDKEWVDFLHDSYRRHNNPIDAWNAYLESRAAGLPVPEWVLEYFDRAADKILNIANQYTQGRVVDNPASAVAEALEMKPKGARKRVEAFKKWVNRRWIFYGATVGFYIRQGDKDTFAIEAVAKQHRISESTVRLAWKKYQKEYPQEA